jgi:leucyl aminopeptidase
MVILEYRPQGRAGVIEEGGKAGKAVLSVKKKGGKSGPHLALVGKGVCFDTGGISIKPAGDMWRMKGDMAGAGAVLGAMMAIAKLKPSIPVTGILVLALNAVDAHSLLPGDVLRARNGKTIHVDNTDAEGRLILTDGLYEAKERGATHCVDVATLTGACSRALGPALAGLFSNDDGLAEELLRAGQAHGEGFWRLPLVEEYRSMLKTDNADLNNVGGPTAGAITAALFLEEFVAPGMKWAHLDIAGTGLPGKPRTGMAPGATGFATRTLAALALALGPGDAA